MNEMENTLRIQRIGHRCIRLDEVGSTNDELKRLAEEGAAHGTVLIANRQTKGRGRMGRSWDSPAGDNIYMSVLLRPDIAPTKASMLTLVAALAVAEAVDDILESEGARCQIKWPNDLVLEGRKICGILTEMSGTAEGIRYVIVGIGINVNRENFPEEIAHMAASIPLPSSVRQSEEDDSVKTCETQVSRGKEALMEKLFYSFQKKYDLFIEQGDLKPFLEEYNGRLAGLGRQVQILSREGARIGISQGIEESGALIVSDETGKREKIISGEVSVRGLYGYAE